MAKLSNYGGSVDLISGIRPKNNGKFPLMEAHDILVGANDKRLDDILGTNMDPVSKQISDATTTLRNEVDRDFYDKTEMNDIVGDINQAASEMNTNLTNSINTLRTDINNEFYDKGEMDDIVEDINDAATALRQDVDNNFFNKDEVTDFLYELVGLTISPTSGTFEIGSSNNVSISWTATVKRPNTLTALKINNVAQSFTANDKATSFSGSGTASGVTKSADGTVNVPVVATDRRGNKTVNYVATFTNKVYYGKAAAPSSYNQAFIKSGISGGSNLQTNKSRTFSTTTGAGEYIYFALPTAYGTPSFKVGGFDVSFTKVASAVSVTNDSGYTTTYDIWRSPGANNGTASTVVS